MKCQNVWTELGIVTCFLVSVLGAQSSQPKPITRAEVLSLVAVGAFSESTQHLIQQRGISFLPTDLDFQIFGRAGGEKSNPAALQKTLHGAKVMSSTEEEVSTESLILQHLARCGELNNSADPKSSEAEVECRAALSLAPRDPFVLLAVGTTLINQQKRKEACAVFRRVLALDPSLALGHLLLADALLGAGDEYRDEGLVEGVAAMRLDPESNDIPVSFVFLFGDGGVSDRDIATLRKEANAHINDPVPHLMLGLALHASRDTKAAFAEFETARKLGLDNAFLRKVYDHPVHEAPESQSAGRVHMIDKDKSTFTIKRGIVEVQVVYNGDTTWTAGETPSSPDELKENRYVNCKGRFDAGKVFATTCRFRDSN